MQNIVGVRFKKIGKIYFFEPGKWELKKGQNVIFYNYRKKRPFRYRHTTVKPSFEILEDKDEEIFQKLVWKKKN